MNRVSQENQDLGNVLPEVVSRNGNQTKVSLSIKNNLSRKNNYSKYLKEIQSELNMKEDPYNRAAKSNLDSYMREPNRSMPTKRVNFNQEAYRKKLLHEIKKEIYDERKQAK